MFTYGLRAMADSWLIVILKDIVIFKAIFKAILFVQKADSVQSIQSCLWLYFEMVHGKKRQKSTCPVDYHFKRIYV